MSLTYPAQPARPLLWGLAAVLSAALHLGLPAAILSALPEPAEKTPQPEGVTGAILFDLSDIIAAPAAAQEDSAAQPETDAAPTVTESPEPAEAAKAADQPLLAQIPYEVEDDSLAFGVAAPEPEADTEDLAERIATEPVPEQEEAQSQLGAEAREASAETIAGVDAAAEAERATAESEGLTAEQTAQIQAWQKDIVLRISGAKTYPAKARSDRIEGEVQVRFTLDRYGALLSAEVAQSSGAPVLDAAALRTVQQLGKLPTPPSHLAGSEFTLIVPLRYSFR